MCHVIWCGTAVLMTRFLGLQVGEGALNLEIFDYPVFALCILRGHVLYSAMVSSTPPKMVLQSIARIWF